MIGTRLGQYRIDALLGQGGMGAVYLATDEMLGRQVAIKVLRDDVDTQGTATERFRSEAQILARLDHPQILRLYGFSQHEGVLYMVTEFVRGEALLRRLESGTPLDTSQVLEWAGQILEALDYAHGLGVVHRDIKPANILIDERNRARLLDFGIARIVGTDGPTQTGHAVGTLTYMAPEQVLDEPIDGRADIYAFAVVLCQMLAGRRPYRSTTTAGLIREIVDGPSPDFAVLLPPHTAMFAPALTRALARRPADRTPTAGQLRQELMAVAPVARPPLPLDETVVATEAAPPTDPDRTVPVPPPTSRPHRAGPLAWVAPAALLLAVGAAGWYALAPGPGRPEAPPGPQAAVPPVPPPAQPAPVAGPLPETAAASPAVRLRPPAPRAGAPGDAAGVSPSAPARREGVAAPTSDSTEAPPAGTAEPGSAAEATERPTGRPTLVFKDLLLIDRVDGEDEEFDVSMRLDGRRLVLIDEDGVARRSLAYSTIARATYNARRPGRFSLRRGPSHWLTLEVGITPVVVRLNGKTYEQVLRALQDRGVHVERLP
jgi:serine/threonine-protein kinase